MGRGLIRYLSVHQHAVYPGMSLADRPANPSARGQWVEDVASPCPICAAVGGLWPQDGPGSPRHFAVRFAQMVGSASLRKNFEFTR